MSATAFIFMSPVCFQPRRICAKAATAVAFHKRFSLKVHLSIIFLLLAAAIFRALVYFSYQNTTRIIETLTRDFLARATAETTSETEAFFAPAGTVVDLMGTLENLQTLREVARLKTVPFLVRGFKESKDIATVHVGNHQGDFLLVRRCRAGDSLLGEMTPPEGSA